MGETITANGRRDGIPRTGTGIPIAGDSGIPHTSSGIPAGIPSEDDKPTTAKVRPSTKRIVAELKDGDESFEDTIRRVFGKYATLQPRIADLVTSNEHLQTIVDELEDDLASEQEASATEIEALKHRITGLEVDIEKLIDATPTTALTTPSEQSQLDLGGDVLKDTIDAVKGACGDEESCVKTALHLIDTKASMVNSQSSRDHDARQKDLDRDERDKDRKLKQDLADGKAKHEKDLAMIKKGIVHEADLEGVIFLGEHRHKSAKAAIEDRKKQARRASDDDEEWDALEGDVL